MNNWLKKIINNPEWIYEKKLIRIADSKFFLKKGVRYDRLERLWVTFTADGKREFVLCDQFSPLTCPLLFISPTPKLVASR